MSHRVAIRAGRALGLMAACLAMLGVLGWSARGGQDEPIDFQKARRLQQRLQEGERLSEEERTFLERAKVALRKKQAARKGVGLVEKDHVGLVPLTDLAGEARYKGQDGGLYGGGRNEPPEGHLRAAMAAAREIRPLGAEGRPSPDGRAVLISVGMSNTTQEFQAFLRLARPDPDKSPSLVIVDGAQGAMDASAWSTPEKVTRAGQLDPWTILDRRLQQAGVTARQVQVAWVKQARGNPSALGEFPKHADALKDDLAVIVRELKERFPNLRIVYLSSRIYAGYANTPLNPEPFAYESSFAVRRLIREQIEGRSDLNPDPGKGRVVAPVLLWGPYLWADGVQGRKADDLTWKRADLGPDGTHPSADGQRKVAALLLRFFRTDPTAKVWFSRPAPPRSGAG